MEPKIQVNIERELEFHAPEIEAYEKTFKEKISYIVEHFYGFSPTDDRVTDYKYKELCDHVRGILLEGREFDLLHYNTYIGAYKNADKEETKTGTETATTV